MYVHDNGELWLVSDLIEYEILRNSNVGKIHLCGTQPSRKRKPRFPNLMKWGDLVTT